MLRIYLFINDRFKKKAVLETDGKELVWDEQTYQRLQEYLEDIKDHSYICNDQLVFTRLKDLWLHPKTNKDLFKRLKIFVNSRLIFGSKFALYRETRKYDFSKTFSLAFEKVNRELEKKKC